jgi:transposase
MEAMRSLKRRLSDIVYHQMTVDARTARTDPGGHSGTTLQSSVTDLTPPAGSSNKPLPGSASQQPKTLSLTMP